MLNRFILFLLCSFLILQCSDRIDFNQNQMVFFNTQNTNVEHSALIDKQLYAQFVQQMPVCCIDIFVYSPTIKAYFLVLRNVPPAQGIYFFPGGRLYKGESFFECAKRKCWEEVGLTIEPLNIIDVYNTIYPDSAWSCQAHTINVAIFALCTEINASLNADHLDYKWQSIDEIPKHAYLKDIYQKARLNYINQHLPEKSSQIE